MSKSIFRDTINDLKDFRSPTDGQKLKTSLYRYLIIVRGQDHIRAHHMKYLTTITVDSTDELLEVLHRDDKVLKGLCMNDRFRVNWWKRLDIRDVENTVGDLSLDRDDVHSIAKYVRDKMTVEEIKTEIKSCTGLNQTIILYDETFECLEFDSNSNLQIIEKHKDSLYCY